MRSIPATFLLLVLVACDGPTILSSHPEVRSAAAIQGATTGLVPLNDLGSGFYLGLYQGGLYPGGLNLAPADHAAEGRARAKLVQPLNTQGKASASGKYVLLSIGMSNAGDEWCTTLGDNTPCNAGTFMDLAKPDPAVNSKSLVIANGAIGGRPMVDWLSPSSPEYNRIRDKVLKPLKLAESQVQVIWVKQANQEPQRSLPDPDAEAMEFERQLGTLLRTLRTRYPNLQQVFVSSRVYAGYSTLPKNPEPYAYEYGFSVKWTIEAQIEQLRSGVVDAEAGDLDYRTVSPWVAWGPYLWADGVNPRSDGLVWLSSDYRDDNTHLIQSGVDKVATSLLTFFKTSEFTTCWFLANPVCGDDPPPANVPPSASFTSSCAELTCSFTDTSKDSDGQVVGWSWQFGDGASATVQHPSRTYAAGGTYSVSLTVTDNQGATHTTSQSATVGAPSTGGISLSVKGYKVKSIQYADLTWSGASGANVDVFRSGVKIATPANSGAYTDNIGAKGGGSYLYKICEAGTASCSNEVTVTF